MYIYIYTCIYAHGCLDPSQTECDRFRPPCDLATIVEVFDGRVLWLVCLRPMYNHHTMVAADLGQYLRNGACDLNSFYFFLYNIYVQYILSKYWFWSASRHI